jgi:hypothetical protein
MTIRRALAELGGHMLFQDDAYIDYGFLKVAPYTNAPAGGLSGMKRTR